MLAKIKQNPSIIFHIITLALVALLFYKQNKIETRLGMNRERTGREKMVQFDQKAYEAAGMVAGNPAAKSYVMLFNSFTCGFCKKTSENILELLKQNPDKLKFVYQHFDRNKVDDSLGAVLECSAKQNKLVDGYRGIFAYKNKKDTDGLIDSLKSAGIEPAKVRQCLKANDFKARLDKGRELGKKLGMRGTPGIVINGKMFYGHRDLDTLKAAL